MNDVHTKSWPAAVRQHVLSWIIYPWVGLRPREEGKHWVLISAPQLRPSRLGGSGGLMVSVLDTLL